MEKIYQVHQDLLVIDLHCDAISRMNKESYSLLEKNKGHVDLPRLREGKVDVQVFAIYVPEERKPYFTIKDTLQMIALFHEEIKKSKGALVHLAVKEDFTNFLRRKKGKVGAILALEGGEALCGDLSLLNIYYQLGVRLITLTWSTRNELADGVSVSATPGGLTSFGKKAVQMMNQLGIVVDVSHIAPKGFWDVLAVSSQPVIASHSGCYSLCPHNRNLTNDQIKALSEKGGLIGIDFVPQHLTNTPQATTLDVLRHIAYVIDLVGDDHVALGSDYDGTDYLPEGLEDVAQLPFLAKLMVQHGFSESTIRKVLGENALNLFEKILK